MGDDDLAVALPQPPPPNPARRAAAIDAALRRFDSDGSAARPPRKGVERGWWRARLYRPRAIGLATAALAGLAVLVGAPAAWLSDDPRPPSAGPTSLAAASPDDRTLEAAPPPPSPFVAVPAVAPSAIADASPAKAPVDDSIARCGAEICSTGSGAATAPVSPAPSTAFARNDAASARLDSAAQYRFSPPPTPQLAAPAPAPVAAAAPPALPTFTQGAVAAPAVTAENDEPGASSIVVTGARRARQPFDRRGDWNACTVNDPDQTLGGCRALVNPGAPGAKGRAAARVADGLALAWQGDLQAAIAQFDQAIAIAPRSAFAYLNRGIAVQRTGDLDRALGDLDSAVRYAPAAARGYYNRSLLLRQRGDLRKARLDEQRATDLDSEYSRPER